MYQRIDFTKLGGFPLTQDTMEFIQNSYNLVFEAISYMAGARVIMSGVIEGPPNTFSTGWLCIDGEILPFDGGVAQTNLSIVQTTQDYSFRDGVSNTVLFERKAVFDASGTIPWSSFNRLSLESLKTYIDNVNTAAANAQNTANAALSAAGAFTPGMIIMWSGNPASVPSGWRLCDGLDGRPNLKGRFIVGYDAADADYNAIGKLGGSKTVTLTPAQLPLHTHEIFSDGAHTHALSGGPFARWIDNEANAGSGSSGNEVAGSGVNTTNSSGTHAHGGTTGNGSTKGLSGQAHENRPLYYTLAYIIKI